MLLVMKMMMLLDVRTPGEYGKLSAILYVNALNQIYITISDLRAENCWTVDTSRSILSNSHYIHRRGNRALT